MGTVKDTESFIAASVALHGNRYDYSQSIWTRTSGRITVICRVCGPFEITADSHYRKGCGCRECGLKSRARRKGQYQVCPYCRKWAKYRNTSRRCRDCADLHVKKTETNRTIKNTRSCPSCKKSFTSTDKRQVYCSRDCGFQGRTLERATVPCGYCGSEVTKPRQHIEKFHAVFCDLTCQQKWRAIKSNGTDTVSYWTRRSERAKDRWKKTKSRERRKANKWLQIIPKQMARLRSKKSQANKTAWERKCESASSTLRQRVVQRPRVARKKAVLSWESAVIRQLKAVEGKVRRQTRGPWERKCDSVASNLRKRAKRRARR